jgi:hypothetical protein
MPASVKKTPSSPMYRAFRAENRKCAKKGKLTNPRTHKCIKKRSKQGKSLTKMARKHPKKFANQLSDWAYNDSEIPKVARAFKHISKKSKKNKRTRKDLIQCLDKYEQCVDVAESWKRKYEALRKKQGELPLKRMKKVAATAAAAGAAAVAEAISARVVTASQAPALAARAAAQASANITITPDGKVIPLNIRRKGVTGSSVAAAAAVSVVEDKAGSQVSSKTLHEIASKVAPVATSQTGIKPVKTYQERMADLANVLGPGIRGIEPGEETGEVDIYNIRIKWPKKDGVLFVHEGAKPSAAEQDVINKLKAEAVTPSKLTKNPSMVKGKCVIFNEIEMPDFDSGKAPIFTKMVDEVPEFTKDAIKYLKRAKGFIIISKEDANDFALTALEPVSGDLSRDFEGFHSLHEFKKAHDL